ncbi:MAG TPA: hypothetical protein VN924_02965 [Bryobacteraceae bacterium]|nr:hypothetical protein [Bryobacteraceae bacterium]
MARIVSLFIASPGDVAAERNHVADVAAALNRNVASERDVRFEALGWKTHARSGLHEKGPQGPIPDARPANRGIQALKLAGHAKLRRGSASVVAKPLQRRGISSRRSSISRFGRVRATPSRAGQSDSAFMVGD